MNKDRILNSVIRGGMEVDVTTAVYSLVENASCHIVDGKIVEWGSDETQPTEAEIDAEVKRLEKQHSDNQYQRDRLKEFPSIQECVHAILDDNLTALQKKRQTVKTKYPKS